MAVYKSTYCYPFLNSVDLRTAKTKVGGGYPTSYLSCKIDTSNKNITGYKIKLLDSDNNQIFPVDGGQGEISPLKELQQGGMTEFYDEKGTNSGINGTYLKIPFFQNYKFQRLDSYNAIYYKPSILADHIIMSTDLEEESGIQISFTENIDNWEIDSTTIPGENCLRLLGIEDGTEVFFHDNDEKKVDTDYQMIMASETEDDGGATTVSVITETDPTTHVVYVLGDVTDTGEIEGSGEINEVYDFKKNKVVLDGEAISLGEVIFVCSNKSDSKTGFYKVVKVVDQQTKAISTLLEPIASWNNSYKEYADGMMVAIKKASKFHNTVWNISKEGIASYTPRTKNMWCDRDGNSIINLNVDGDSYKWEITLYQGDCKVTGTPMIADYSDIGTDNYDIILGNGNVCGSYSDRIQIASDNAFSGNGELNSDAIIPGLKSDTLILQTRYMGLKNIQNENSITEMDVFTGDTRVYVKTYVEDYGYVYPESSSLNNALVSASTHVQFFKHSNNVDEILDTDIVEYGTSEKINIYHYSTNVKSDEDYVEVSDDWKQGDTEVGVNDRMLVISSDGILPDALAGMSSGQKVLLVNQRGYRFSQYGYHRENGVYTLNMITHNEKTYYYLTRAASYTSWSNFIGKVIYVRKGDLGGKNIQSLAQAGSYVLWNPLDPESSDSTSELGFSFEHPILLFQNKLKDGRSYDFFSGYETYPEDGTLDGENLTVGNIVLSGSGKVFIVSASGKSISSGGSGYWSEYPIDQQGNSLQPSKGDYVYFSHGMGAECVYIYSGTGIIITWKLHTAKILHNTSNYTYISPSMILKDGMCLKLTHGKEVQFEGSSSTKWIKIKKFNSVLNCVWHDTLESPSMLASSESSSSGTPWKYELRSYFRSSDENPFYSNEFPYAVLYKNSQEYTNLAMISQEDGTYIDASVVTGRSVKLSAKYKQFQNASWESYRWVLKDYSGSVLQDTGKKYDNEISVIFYGLSTGENNTAAIYYAVLFVEDDLGNNLQYTLRLSVKQSTPNSLPTVLTAEYECGIQAVRLDYQENGILMPGYRLESDNSYDYKYDASMPTFWDGGVIYEDEKAVITNKDYNQSAPIDYTQGSTISGDDAELNYSSLLSLAEKSGLNYYVHFNRTDSKTTSSSSNALKLKSQSSDGSIDSNQLYFETEFVLMDNFCGEILDWCVQGKDLEEIEDLYVTTEGSTNNKSGYLEFEIKTEDNLVDSVPYEMRNRLKLVVTAYDGVAGVVPTEHSKTMQLTGLNLFEISESPYYYMQPQKIINEKYRTGEYEFLHYTSLNPLYIKKDIEGLYFTGGEYILGNLCLIKEDNTSASTKTYCYWAEDRPLLDSPSGGEMLESTEVQRLKFNSRTTGTEEGLLLWDDLWGEDGTTSASIYNIWKDGDYDEEESPLIWEDVEAIDSHVTQMISLNRHYGMSKNSYHILCRLNDVDSIYNSLINDELQLSESSSEDNQLKISIIDKNSNGLGEILIKQDQKEE